MGSMGSWALRLIGSWAHWLLGSLALGLIGSWAHGLLGSCALGLLCTFYDFNRTFYIIIPVTVAGSTSLALLIARLLVSKVLIPRINNKVETIEVNPSPDSGLKTKSKLEQEAAGMELTIRLLKTFDSLASIFSTCWLIVGSYYVYSTYEYVTHHSGLDNQTFCNYTAYTFAFIVITIGFISLGLSIIAALCACFCKSSDDAE
jgi:hypothetical protein